MVKPTRAEWEGVIEASEKQLELMEKTKREMEVAGEVQKVILKFANERLKDFPEPKSKNPNAG